MGKQLQHFELYAGAYIFLRFVVVPAIVRFIGTIAFYTASKLGEDAALAYLEAHLHIPWMKKK